MMKAIWKDLVQQLRKVELSLKHPDFDKFTPKDIRLNLRQLHTPLRALPRLFIRYVVLGWTRPTLCDLVQGRDAFYWTIYTNLWPILYRAHDSQTLS
jgi:hypothetical protein